MEIKTWNQYFELEAQTFKSVCSIWKELSTPSDSHKHLSELKRKLIAELPCISKIQSTLRIAEANIERVDPNNFDLASKNYLIIEDLAKKSYETIIKSINKHNIKLAASTSINILVKKTKPMYNKLYNDRIKFYNIIAHGRISHASRENFYSIDNSIVKSLNACSRTSNCQHLVSAFDKFHSATNNNQIRKIFREFKHLINEEIEKIHKIHLSYLAKVKLLFKSVWKQKISKKNVISKRKNLTDNELPKLIVFISSLCLFIAKLEVSLNSTFIARRKVSWNCIWKYFRKKKHDRVILQTEIRLLHGKSTRAWIDNDFTHQVNWSHHTNISSNSCQYNKTTKWFRIKTQCFYKKKFGSKI